MTQFTLGSGRVQACDPMTVNPIIGYNADGSAARAFNTIEIESGFGDGETTGQGVEHVNVILRLFRFIARLFRIQIFVRRRWKYSEIRLATSAPLTLDKGASQGLSGNSAKSVYTGTLNLSWKQLQTSPLLQGGGGEQIESVISDAVVTIDYNYGVAPTGPHPVHITGTAGEGFIHASGQSGFSASAVLEQDPVADDGATCHSFQIGAVEAALS